MRKVQLIIINESLWCIRKIEGGYRKQRYYAELIIAV